LPEVQGRGRTAPLGGEANATLAIGLLALLSIALAVARVASGLSQPPLAGLGAAALAGVALPYGLVLWWSLRGQSARASALAFGSALVAILSLALFAGLFTLFLGFAMGNRDQIRFAWLLDAFVLVQVPLAVLAWRGYRRVPAQERPKGCWTLGLGLPLAIALALVALFNRVRFSLEDRRETIQRNEQAARDAMAAAAACLRRRFERTGSFPPDLVSLGPAGDGCLEDRRAAGDLPSHRLHYSAGVPDAQGHRVLYSLCAEVTGFRRTGWRTYVTDETGPMRQYEPRPDMTRGPTCGEAWDGAWGEGLALRVKHCAVEYAARFPDRGYPPTLDALRPAPGTGCLAPSVLADLRLTGGQTVVWGERQVRYRAGAADAPGPIAAFEVQAEVLWDGRWTLRLMVEETGRRHAAEGRDATRVDPAPEDLGRDLQARDLERAAAWAAERRRCEAGEAALCRDLGGAGFDAGRDGEAQALWQRGCDQGDGVSCLLTLRQTDYPLFSLANTLRHDCLSQVAGACAKMERAGRDHLACRRGDWGACSWLAARLGQRGQTFDANRIWERGCGAGHRESCFLLGARDFDCKEALELKDLCDQGRGASCEEFDRRMAAFLAPDH
jgi:hypothetical protein